MADTHIIGVTAHALEGDRERVIQAGMNDYLTKPIDKRALLDKVTFWTSQNRRGQATEDSEPAQAECAAQRQLRRLLSGLLMS